MKPSLLHGLAALLTCVSSRSASDSWTAETERLTRPNDAEAAIWPPEYVAVTHLEQTTHQAMSPERPALWPATGAAPSLWSQMPMLVDRISQSTDVVEGKRSSRARVTPGCCPVESAMLKDSWAKASSDDSTFGDYHVFAGALPHAVTRGLFWDELRLDSLLFNSKSHRSGGGGRGRGSTNRRKAAEVLPTGREGALQARIAPVGAITPLHYDSGANVVLQVTGNKTWWLFPPEWLSVLSPYPKLHVRHRQSQLRLQDLLNLTYGKQLPPKADCKVDTANIN
eukprot:COSAG02_NODE_2669_length_8290_cov_8.246856_1_plen_281_part_10